MARRLDARRLDGPLATAGCSRPHAACRLPLRAVCGRVAGVAGCSPSRGVIRMTQGEPDADQETAYGADQDREGTTSGIRPDAADRSPDDLGPEAMDGDDVNPATGAEPGAIDNSAHRS